jgi:hypothetical protein
MVTNSFQTNDVITYEALIVLKNELGMGNRCIRSFDGSFGVQGAKVGDTMRIRIPPRYVTTSGPAPSQQSITDNYAVLQANNQMNIFVEFTSKDRALAIDDLSDRLITPAMRQMASDIDSQGVIAATVGYSVNNSNYFPANYAGTYAGFALLATPLLPGSTGPAQWTGNTLGQSANSVQTASQPFFNAMARLDEQSAPSGERYCVLSPAASATVQPQLFINFNPSATISEMFTKGVIGQLAGADFYKTPNIQQFTSGTRGNGTVSITSNNADVVLSVGGIGNAATVVQGDQFCIAGVYDVNPLNRTSTGFLKVWTVTAAATANTGAGLGNVVLSVFPAIAYSSNAVLNQGATCGSLPVAGNTVTWCGPASTTTQVNLMYNKNAIALAVAPLARDLPGAEVEVVGDDQDGMQIRYVKQYQGSIDQVIERFDVLFGWAVVRQELGCRIQA